MDEIAAPGILAYRAGDCFANLVSIIDEIPAGKDISSTTLEHVLQSYVPYSCIIGLLLNIWLDIKYYYNPYSS